MKQLMPLGPSMSASCLFDQGQLSVQDRFRRSSQAVVLVCLQLLRRPLHATDAGKAACSYATRTISFAGFVLRKSHASSQRVFFFSGQNFASHLIDTPVLLARDMTAEGL